MGEKTFRPIIIWLFIGAALVFAMVVIGGITRLTHSGLSMVDWNLISGAIPPLSEGQWLNTFEQYQKFPEFQKLNYNFTLDDFKQIFWWEYLHRLLGRIIGIVFLIPYFYFLFKNKIDSKLNRKLLLILALGAFQGFMGWYMVKSGLVDVPYVSHYRLAAHLITALITFVAIIWTAFGLMFHGRNTRGSFDRSLIRMTRIFIFALFIQIIYGAFVAGLKAGFVYNTFPLMGDSWMPEAVTALNPLYLNFIKGLAGVQFAHRIIAYLVFALGIVIFFKGKSSDLGKTQKGGLASMIIMLNIQLLLGISALIFKVPVTLGVLHQVGAFMLVFFAIFFYHRLLAPKNNVKSKLEFFDSDIKKAS
ncbi:COX15/CtaA family protein [Aureibacter tunicatorum]|uniref:Cytochrome c oxidase assembly protein subunit 15 n=1 Tax=Aureibacter tunicatorum TaxID=866807 RepID=A0AAE4BU51_9BACT|nr:COX15/CtaA family protein [Aureibacter tunicatorum]MDR6240357.1 cytochrome c oxidase assembly protein subunit 15 [Aureibacter tunicatorum]BDD05762.1 heme A synthase [Aureibacter tunicatorum]